jgi:aspartyl-tRNA synthetase
MEFIDERRNSEMETHRYRTHKCDELRKEDEGKIVKLSGWIHSVRDHGGIIFIDLRDHYGLTQVVINPEREFYQNLEHWRTETVVCFAGQVIKRSPETINPQINTGEVEVVANGMEVLGKAEPLPFQIASETDYPEALRLKYRFLDLRRSRIHKNILKRSKVICDIRAYLTGIGFNEIQTPILTSSSPEGARDFLVPSRLHPGKFYALPQAPQQFKQLLMVAGFDRYFQIAPCFRDEDARADRTPGEFYQLDMEMSFVTQEEIFRTVEELLYHIFLKHGDKEVIKPPFRKMAYREAMLKYGTDKPDLRNPLEIIDVTNILKETGFLAFTDIIKEGGVIRAIPVKGISNQPRKFFDDMISFSQSIGAKGLAYIIWSQGIEKSPVVKFMSRTEIDNLMLAGNIRDGDVMFFVADNEKTACELAGRVRSELAARLGLIDKGIFSFCWIVDFPMYEYNEQESRIDFSHNPFSMPQGGLEALETSQPLEILAFQYDLVCNGIELSSGAIRNHDIDTMYRAFEIAGYSKEQVDEKFGAMINGFRYGAPPHGGIAPGIDRMMMLLSGESNLREVIAFPLNQRAEDLMMNAPSEVHEKQLRELSIKPLNNKKH